MIKELSKVEQLSQQRKDLIASGDNPAWLTTPGWQMIHSNYLTEKDNTLKKTFKRISKACSKHMPNPDHWYPIFFDLLWSGDLALSTPILANLGTKKGMPVSCCGNYCDDSVEGFYESTKDAAILSKNGFGTSTYLGDIRPRGTPISVGGTASGVLPVIKQHIQMARDITQGTRRGAWAGYLELDHGDFWETVNFLEHNPEDFNMGWLVTDKFIERLKRGDEDANNIFRRSLKIKLQTGKGYYVFIDRMNDAAPQIMKDTGLVIKASNLCTEIALPADDDHIFTCVLASMNAARYDNWAENAVFNSTVFLDCVASEFILRGKEVGGLDKAIRFTEKARSLGLGVLGFHTLLQMRSFPFASIDANYLNTELFQTLERESIRASVWMAIELGEPEWCKGTGRRNMNLQAIAPNTSSSVIAGSVSPGVEPLYANAFLQPLAGGEVNRVNAILIDIMKEAGVYNNTTIKDLLFNDGSVQHVSWLSDHDKLVFLTAFEIDQRVIIRLASARQRFIDQAQSINLFFPNGTPEEYIAEIHQEAFLDPRLLSLYYIRSNSKNKASDGACSSCES